MKKANLGESFRTNYGGLPRSVYILFAATVINRIGGFVYAFLALFLKSKLDMSADTIATFVLISGGVTMVAPFIGGGLADRKGRKAILIAGSTIGALIFAVCGMIVGQSPEIIPYLLIAASFFFSMTGPIYRAMMADIVSDEDDRRRAFSLIYLGINLGVAIGPIIGGFLLANHVQWFFIGDAVTTLIGAVLIALFVKETILTKEEMEQVTGGEKMEKGNVLKVFFKKPVLALFTFVGILTSAVYAQSGFGLSLHMTEFFGNNNGASYFGMLLSFNAFVVIFLTIAITEAMKKNRPVVNMIFGAFFYVIGFGMIAFIGDFFALYFVSVLFWTLGEIIMMTNFNIFMMSHTPVNYRGRFTAIIGFITGTGFVVSSKLMSYMITHHGYKVAWMTVGTVALVAAAGLYLTSFIDARMKKEEKVVLEEVEETV